MVETPKLPPEKKEEIKVSSSSATTVPEAIAAAQNSPALMQGIVPEIPAIDKTLESSPPKHDKKAARFAFNAVNFLGLHWVGNSALSLWITYNIANKPTTQKFLHGLADSVTPVVNGMEKLKASIGMNGLSNLSKEMREHHIKQSARSFTETACMCVAGSIILFPVKWLEDHKSQFVDKVDGWLHPSNKNAPKTKAPGDPKAVQAAPPEEHKETWTNLIRARVLALFPIFAIDNRIQSYNNQRAALNKPNIDTLEWNMGSKIYDNLKPATREGFINFFSSKGISKEGIQPLVRKELEKTVGSDAGRMVFAEQTRMFSKEVSLTLIYTGFLYLLGKTPVVPFVMEKIGLKSKKEPHQEAAALPQPAAREQAEALPVIAEPAIVEAKEKAVSHTSHIQPKKRDFVPTESYSKQAGAKPSEMVLA